LSELRERGYLVFEGFLAAEELALAREMLWLHFPRPEEYYADPAAHAWLGTSQFAGIIGGPRRSWALNRLTFHPDLLDLAERFLGSDDLRLYEAELWAKYEEAVDYDQSHHRDFGSHTQVVPKRSDPATQMRELGQKGTAPPNGQGDDLCGSVLVADVRQQDQALMEVCSQELPAAPEFPALLDVPEIAGLVLQATSA
jgi:hypothetical protein